MRLIIFFIFIVILCPINFFSRNSKNASRQERHIMCIWLNENNTPCFFVTKLFQKDMLGNFYGNCLLFYVRKKESFISHLSIKMCNDFKIFNSYSILCPPVEFWDNFTFRNQISIHLVNKFRNYADLNFWVYNFKFFFQS